MRTTLTAVVVALLALGSVSAHAAGCNYGNQTKQSTPPATSS
ncbi:MAG: hypothetical protein AAF409_16805 [Pseudomonadota bacterium]